jgi:hypothetical protein
MTKCRAASLILVSIFLSTHFANAQVITDKAVLQRASQLKAAQEAEMHRIVLSLAAKKGWPLTIKNKKGRLAYLKGVNSTGQPVYITTTDNIISAATIRTSTLWAGGSTGLNLSGSSGNMAGRLAVWDEGKVRATHVEFSGRVTQADGASGLSDHSTHVAGTLVAAGVNPVAKGMSYGAQLLAYDFDNDESEMYSAAQNGLLVSNHSYAVIAGWYYNSSLSRWEFWGRANDTSDYKFGYYDADARVWDSIAYYAPNYLIAKAAGNSRSENGPAVGQDYWRYNSNNVMSDAGNRPAGISSNNGYGIIATYGNSKNILTIGAIGPIAAGYSQPSDAVMTNFSSWGPTGDGRIKPDLVADGLNILSSISTSDNAYDVFSGTSMATPASAGSAFLLQEYYSRLHAGAFMRSATLKGLLIHTADEAGAYPGPDYQFGWGVINMQKAASVITSDTSVKRDQQIRENQLINSSHDADSVNIIASGTTPVTATICWTDVPGTPVSEAVVNGTANFHDTGIKLVNDLDLRITDLFTGVTYQPWILNPANLSSAATRGDNIRDNVEKVQLDSLIPGRSYKVRVSHKGSLSQGTPSGSQAYTLLISGAGGTGYCASTPTSFGTSIANVTLTNLNNSTAGCNTYLDYTDKAAARLPIGQSSPINVSYLTCSGSSTANIAIYIDFNNDGTFSGSELVAQNASLLNSSTSAAIFTSSITVPANIKAGTYTRMRVVVQDAASVAIPAACGSYPSGETQDYRVVFTAPATDVGVTALVAPTPSGCANDSQIVSIRIRNFGSANLSGIPVTTIVKDAGNNTVATLNATCKDTLPAQSDVVFTYNTTFPSAAGATYTFTSQTNLGSDPNTGNDQNTTTIVIGNGASTTNGTATICGANSNTVQLRSSASGVDQPLWYTSPTATTPVAAGTNASTTVIPSNNTYYVGLNDLKTTLGPPDKIAAYTGGAGAYFRLGGNYISITTGVPLTISSARMYFAHNGQLKLTLGTLSAVNGSGFTYTPLYNTSIDVYATKPVPDTSHQINVPAGDNTDAGGLFNLNIPIPTPGDYIIIMDCSDSTSAFVNVGSKGAVPYPISIPGVISVNSNNLTDGTSDTATYRRFWFPFYDINVQLTGCPGTSRTAVVASTEPAPVITLNGNVFTSSFDDGNQWYRGDTAITGSTGKTDTAIYSGTYKTIVNDAVTGCALPSNSILFLSTGTNDVNGSAIGLKISPNPNSGVFQLQFKMTTADNTSIILLNTLGQKVYQKDYPNFVGTFNNTVNAGYLANGMYVLKIIHGNTTYVNKILVKK